MTKPSPPGQPLDRYISEIEVLNTKLAQENAQLRASHSFRLGLAFVSFAKRRSIRAVPGLVREVRAAMSVQIVPAAKLPKRPAPQLAVSAAPAGKAAQPSPASSPGKVLPPDKSPLPRNRLVAAVNEAPVGSSIIEHVRPARARVVGIYGRDLAAALGDSAVASRLPFDRYDAIWTSMRASHLLVETGELRKAFGWQNALTLMDAAATLEFASMVQKARMAGLRTVLVLPEDAYRVPLLNRVAGLFDVKVRQPDFSRDLL